MTRQDVVNALRKMGYIVSGKSKNSYVSLPNDDVSKQDIISLLSTDEFALISRIDFCRHRDEDSFDTVRLVFK